MTGVMNLPESLERLEISPEKADCCKQEETSSQRDDPERFLENLSINAECPKGSCLCNKKRDKDKGLKRLAHRPLILRRSKLNQAVLRAPVFRLPGGADLVPATVSKAVRPLATQVSDPSGRSTSVSDEEDAVSTRLSVASQRPSPSATCCAVQARLSPPPASSSHASASPAPDETSMDELASYFDLFVHIPKKMSRMAEMMYI